MRSGATVEAGHELLDAAARDEEAVLLGDPDPGRHPDDRRRSRPGRRVDSPTTGWSSRRRDRVVLTRRGRLLASEVTVRLLSAASDGRGPGSSR